MHYLHTRLESIRKDAIAIIEKFFAENPDITFTDEVSNVNLSHDPIDVMVSVNAIGLMVVNKEVGAEHNINFSSLEVNDLLFIVDIIERRS